MGPRGINKASTCKGFGTSKDGPEHAIPDVSKVVLDCARILRNSVRPICTRFSASDDEPRQVRPNTLGGLPVRMNILKNIEKPGWK